MKLAKYLVPFLLTTGLTVTSAYAQRAGQETSFDRQLNQRDDQPVREFVQSKENIDVQEKANNLEISGDVRFEWRDINEKGVVFFVDPCLSGPYHEKYRALRGNHFVDPRGLPISHHDFDVEFNLKIKYSYERAWAMAHLQFDNPAGAKAPNDCFDEFTVFNRRGNEVEDLIPVDTRFGLKGSGEGSFISLKRAYIGYNIWADGKHRLDIEIGRRKLDDVFVSEVQFSNRFDGILFKYASAIEEIADWYCTLGGFVIDERVNHFGYVTEIGFLNLWDTGVNIRYSFIDWTKKGDNRCFIHNPAGTRFRNSQITLDWVFFPKIYDYEIPVELYSGFLINHAARKSIFSRCKKKNLAWYAGVYIGNVDKKGDWSMDIEYIAIQAQAVPDYDVGSIGRGNILDEALTDIITPVANQIVFVNDDYHDDYTSDLLEYYEDPGAMEEDFNLYSLPSSGFVGIFPRRGNANFTGWRFEFLYALTDNLSIDFIYEFSNEEDRKIGGRHRYSDFEIEAIYAF